MEDVKENILSYFQDLISDFLYYDRKEDEEMPRGYIEDAVKSGAITVDDMVEKFRKELTRGLGIK